MSCPKCNRESGDDWSECGGACPIPASPHYVADTPHVGAPAVPKVMVKIAVEVEWPTGNETVMLEVPEDTIQINKHVLYKAVFTLRPAALKSKALENVELETP